MTIALPWELEGEIKLNEIQIDKYTCTITSSYTQEKVHKYLNIYPVITSSCGHTFKRKQNKFWLT